MFLHLVDLRGIMENWEIHVEPCILYLTSFGGIHDSNAPNLLYDFKKLHYCFNYKNLEFWKVEAKP